MGNDLFSTQTDSTNKTPSSSQMNSNNTINKKLSSAQKKLP